VFVQFLIAFSMRALSIFFGRGTPDRGGSASLALTARRLGTFKTDLLRARGGMIICKWLRLKKDTI
jgi:hypothetical protein